MFDARLTPAGLSDADLITLKQFGVTGALVFPQQALAVDDVTTSWSAAREQLARLEYAGLDAVTLTAVPLTLAGKRGVASLVADLPSYLGKPGVVALGPLMLHRGSDDELDLLRDQLALAKQLARPVVITAPIARHEALVAKSLAALLDAKFPVARALVDGLTLKSVRSVLARGHVAGLTLHPDRLDVDVAERMVHALGPDRLVLGSGAGDGPSDLLSLPRLVSRLKLARLSGGVLSRVSGKTMRAFLGR